MKRHCLNRAVAGIRNYDGCLADYCVLPVGNLVKIPDSISDDRAVFLEPLSAACSVLEQIELRGDEKATVLGDGRIGILCAWVLSTVLSDVSLVGHHPGKFRSAEWRGLTTAGIPENMINDLVVDATGSGKGISQAMQICRPRGTIVLKSTITRAENINFSSLVVNEQRIIGSRCGRFSDGLRIMEKYPDMPLDRLITDRFSITQSMKAFEIAAQPDTLKILIEMADD